MNLKVALVVPKMQNRLVAGIPPLNLGYLAGYLRRHVDGVDVRIIDGSIGQDDRKLLKTYVPDLIGITATTPQINSAYSLADWARSEFGGNAYIVMGGIHVSCLPEEASQHCDTVVVGDGEFALLSIVTAWMKGFKSPKIVQGFPIQNLDEIPMPAYDLMDLEAYIANPENAGNTLRANPECLSMSIRCIPLITSRGCNWRCPFCYNSFRTSSVRYHSAKRIVDEVKYLMDNYKVNSIWFTDDEFVVNKKRLKELDGLFTERDLDIPWGCQARATSLDVETMQLMKHFGCKLVMVGIESGNRRMLNFLKANSVSLEDNERCIECGARVGLPVGGSFILGTPSETKEEMYDTLRFIEKSDDIALVGIGALIPYPATTVWNVCMEKRLLPEKPDYDMLVPTSIPDRTYIVCDTMSRGEYVKTFREIHIIAGITQRVRDICRSSDSPLTDLVKLFRYKRMWYFCVRHPVRLIKLLRKAWRIRRLRR